MQMPVTVLVAGGPHCHANDIFPLVKGETLGSKGVCVDFPLLFLFLSVVFAASHVL